MDERIDGLLKKSQKFLQSAAVLLELEDYDSCASRSYFAMLFAAQALLLREHGEINARRGLRSAFIESFVATGQLPDRAGLALNRAAEMQEVGDYAHHFAVPQSDAERALQEAEAFVNTIARLVGHPA